MLDLGELTLDISASPLLDLVIFRAFASGVVVEEFTKLVDITANQTLFSLFLKNLILLLLISKLIIGHYFTTLMMKLGWGKKANLF